MKIQAIWVTALANQGFRVGTDNDPMFRGDITQIVDDGKDRYVAYTDAGERIEILKSAVAGVVYLPPAATDVREPEEDSADSDEALHED